MELVGADTDFGTETILRAIGETGAGVPENTGRIYFTEKFFGGGAITGDNRVAVGAAKFCDVVNRFADAVDDAQADNQIQIFSYPVGVPANFHTVAGERFFNAR